MCGVHPPTRVGAVFQSVDTDVQVYTLHTTHYTLHTTHYTLHTTHYTLHTTHYTLHTTHYTLHTYTKCTLVFTPTIHTQAHETHTERSEPKRRGYTTLARAHSHTYIHMQMHMYTPNRIQTYIRTPARSFTNSVMGLSRLHL